jgi:hypothetical protein
MRRNRISMLRVARNDSRDGQRNGPRDDLRNDTSPLLLQDGDNSAQDARSR